MKRLTIGTLLTEDGEFSRIGPDTILYCDGETIEFELTLPEGWPNMTTTIIKRAAEPIWDIRVEDDGRVFEDVVIAHDVCVDGFIPGLPGGGDHLLPLLLGEVSSIGCSATRTGINPDFVGVATVDDLCRELNSQAGTCEQNGDCVCGSQPQAQPTLLEPDPPRDTDEDGVPDTDDVDDDCDRLSDRLEQAMQFNALSATEDVFALNPFGSGGVTLMMAIQGMGGIPDLDPGKDGHADVYIDLSSAGYRSAGAQDFIPQFSGLTRADPQNNVGSSFSIPDEEFGALGTWAENLHILGSLPHRFTDSAYAWRDGDPVTGVPKLGFTFRVMDKDGATDDGVIGTASTGDGLSLLSLGTLAGGVMNPLIHGVSAGPALVSVQIGATFSSCALAWGYLIANGAYLVELGDDGIYGTRQEC